MTPVPLTGVANPRVRWLDGIRAVAALFVMLHHIWLTAFPGYPENIGPAWTAPLLYGHFAVAVFIVVSGYSLSLSVMAQDMHLSHGKRAFINRRAWRIIPAYWAALAASVAVVAILPDRDVSVRAIAVHSALLQDIIGSDTPNGAFWSIAIEWQIYFLFPLLLLFARRLGLRVAVLLSFLAVVLAHLVGAVAPAFSLDRLTPQFFALFAFGVLAAGIKVSTGGGRASRVLGAIPFIVLGLLVVAHLVFGSDAIVANFFTADLAVGVGVAAALAAMSTGHLGRTSRLLACRPLIFLGAFSYSIYLIHAPILSLSEVYLAEPMHLQPLGTFLALLVIAIPLVLVTSFLFFKLFEEPFLHRRGWSAFRLSLYGRAWAKLGGSGRSDTRRPFAEEDTAPLDPDSVRAADHLGLLGEGITSAESMRRCDDRARHAAGCPAHEEISRAPTVHRSQRR